MEMESQINQCKPEVEAEQKEDQTDPDRVIADLIVPSPESVVQHPNGQECDHGPSFDICAPESKVDSRTESEQSSESSESSEDGENSSSSSDVNVDMDAIRKQIDDVESNPSDIEYDSDLNAESVTLAKTGIRSKNELLIKDLPPVELSTLTINEDACIEFSGKIQSILENEGLLVIETAPPPMTGPHMNQQYAGRILDEGSVLCTAKRAAIGQIFDTFGPVSRPFYSVRFSRLEEIKERGIEVGMDVYQVPEASVYVIPEKIKSKGCDASNRHDEEAGPEEIEFSDDEAEMAIKSTARNRKRKGKTDAGTFHAHAGDHNNRDSRRSTGSSMPTQRMTNSQYQGFNSGSTVTPQPAPSFQASFAQPMQQYQPMSYLGGASYQGNYQNPYVPIPYSLGGAATGYTPTGVSQPSAQYTGRALHLPAGFAGVPASNYNYPYMDPMVGQQPTYNPSNPTGTFTYAVYGQPGGGQSGNINGTNGLQYPSQPGYFPNSNTQQQ